MHFEWAVLEQQQEQDFELHIEMSSHLRLFDA
jgi:hypothetical protein